METPPPRALKRQPTFIESGFSTKAEYEASLLQPTPPVPTRTATDKRSGNPEYFTSEFDKFPGVPEAEVRRYHAEFLEFVLEDDAKRGQFYITPDSLVDLLHAHGMDDMDLEHAKAMLAEVAVLNGHDDDGKLSFRDYMRSILYDEQREENNALYDDAVDELPAGAETIDAAAPADGAASANSGDSARQLWRRASSKIIAVNRMRQSAFSVVRGLTITKINRWKQMEEEQKSAAEASKPAAGTPSGEKLVTEYDKATGKFHKVRKAPSRASSMLGTAGMAEVSLKAKVAAFQDAIQHKAGGPSIDLKKTWKAVGTQRYVAKVMISGGPAPRKSLAELP